MVRFKEKLTLNGQALVEMVLVIPLLALMMAGVVQLTILFEARNAFENACGQAARAYAAGLVSEPNAITTEIWQDLGSYQSYFSQKSISLDQTQPKPTLVNSLVNSIDKFGPAVQRIRSYFINYGGQTWTVGINCTPPFSMTLIFPQGIQFQTRTTVLRYPR